MTPKQKEIALKNIKEVMALRQELFVSQRKVTDMNILLKEATKVIEFLRGACKVNWDTVEVEMADKWLDNNERVNNE